MAEKFGRRFQDSETRQHGFGADFAVESYLHYQGEVFLNRFDALSYLYLTRVMDYYDAFAGIDVDRPGDAFAAVEQAGTRFCLLSFDTDWRFDSSHSRRITHVLERGQLPVTFREIASPWGHDSFLLPIPAYHDTLRAFLERAHEEAL
jgi:homoserine O-acetyltransferase